MRKKLPPAAERALRAAQTFIERYRDYDGRCQEESDEMHVEKWGVTGACKERAALRRASLDLTRALAAIRRPSSL